MYLTVTSYSVPGNFNETDSSIYCNISITGNPNSKPSYWYSTVTVSASSANGCVGFVSNPKTFTNAFPGDTPAAVITGHGIKTGSDTITIKATISPNHQTSSCVRTETKTASAQVTVNAPPDITGGKVTPPSGNVSNTYAFEVNYTDAEGDLPAYVRCFVDSVMYPMNAKDGVIDTVKTKEAFIVSIPGSTIGVGTSHHFNFSSADAKHQAKGDTYQHSGPNILGDSPPTCLILNPTPGSYGGDINVSGSAQDDTWDTLSAVYVSFGFGPWLLANGTSSWYLMANLSLLPNGQLNISAKAVTGTVESAVVKVSVTVDHSLINTPPTLAFDLSQDSVVTDKVWINGTVTDTDLPLQAISVLVGIGYPPSLPANVTGTGSTRAWSFLLDLAGYSEGKNAIYAKALDTYTSSPQMKLDIRVNWPPMLDIDPPPSKIWGVFEFSGNVVDHESALNVSISWDNGTEYPANVSDGRWSIEFDVTTLTETTHYLRVVATDGIEATIGYAAVVVGGPIAQPIYIFSSPENDTLACPGCTFTCMVKYIDGDHRGTMVDWYLNAVKVREEAGNGTTILTVTGNELGTMLVKAVVYNKADPDLAFEVVWTIEVKADLEISPVGPTEVGVTVGELVLLRFAVIEGNCTGVVWTQDGTEIGGGYFIYYLPETSGRTEFEAVASDDYGNLATITFNVTATEGNATVSPPPAQKGLSPLTSIVIGCMAILLVLALIYTVVAVVRSRSNRSEAPPPQAKPAPQPAPAPPVQQLPANRYSWGAKPQAHPQSFGQGPQVQSAGVTGPAQAAPFTAQQHPEAEFPTTEDFGPTEEALDQGSVEVFEMEPDQAQEANLQTAPGGDTDEGLESF